MRLLAAVLVLLAPLTAAVATKVNYCQGGRFQPCICWQDVPTTVQYRPSDVRCRKSTYSGDTSRHVASLELSGNLAGSFSAVVRDTENADRSPFESSTCSFSQFNAGLNRCSRWKAQSTINRGSSKVLCLGASGFSGVFKRITRITVKVSNGTLSNGQKDIRRYCLKSSTKALNVKS